MHPVYFEEQEPYKTSNLMFSLIFIVLVFVGLYFLWLWCSEKDDKKKSKSDQLFMKPVYAHEIEPGIVVLQSEDGDYFKIMKEYDLQASSRYGSVSCTRPEALQPNLSNPYSARADISTMAHYTQARIQNTTPSAPELFNARETTVTLPPPYQAN